MKFAEEVSTKKTSIEQFVSEKERKDYIQKALQIHMLDNREQHAAPPGQTLFSFTQGEENAMIGKTHQFAKAFGEEGQQEQKQQPQQQAPQHDQSWQFSSEKREPAPVRTCPCCARFLTDKFGLNEKQAKEFMQGADTTTGYQSGQASSYENKSQSGEYSGSSTNYSSREDRGYSSSTEYQSNKPEYQ